MQQAIASPAHAVPQRKLQVGDMIFAAAARFAGAFVLILLGAIIVLLIYRAVFTRHTVRR